MRQVAITGRWFTGAIAGMAAALIVPIDLDRFALGNLAVFTAMMLATMVGFIWNDIYDYEADIVAGKNRPIARGTLSRGVALQASIMLATAAVALSWWVFGLRAMAGLAAVLIALAFYSPVSRSGALIKPGYVASLAVSPFLFGSLAFSVPISLPVVSAVLIYIFFRELLLDTTEFEADRKAGIPTLDRIASPAHIWKGAWLGMHLALGMGALFVQGTPAKLLMLCAIITHIYAYAVIQRSVAQAFRLTRIGMLLGVLSASVGAAGLY